MGATNHKTLHTGYAAILDRLGQLYQDSLDHPSDAALADGLRRLEDALDAHFNRERQLMTDSRYPAAAHHEEGHTLIRRFVHKLADNAGRDEGELVRREVPFLIHLVYEHSRRDDRHLNSYLARAEDPGRPMH